MPNIFDIAVDREGSELAVRVSGDLDIATRARVVDEVTPPLVTGDVRRVIVDLGGVTFCDSSGLGALLDIRRTAGEAGAEMVLRSVPAQVARLLDLTDVDGWLQRE